MFKDHFKFYKVEFSKRIEIKWMDNNFQQFMLKLLMSLEPRSYQAQEFIFEQSEEVNEQIYITSGNISVGF